MHSLVSQLENLADDPRVGTAHLSLYVALLQSREEQSQANPFSIKREELMKRSKILAASTYYLCLKNLNEWGHIEYYPSKTNVGNSQIFLNALDFKRRNLLISFKV
jgi:hypothetical protein